MTRNVQVKRIYEDASPKDGARVLVDRLWPRGISKDRAQLTLWDKEVAPSTELRKWYGHDPARFEEFQKRYKDELSSGEQTDGYLRLQELARKGPLTLLTASKAVEISEATALQKLLNGSWNPNENDE
ncbi:DUF488 family protein [Actinomycetaceae bacterium MB13-C1-2]|nr:DUF488 family protein [Actinomycetaceae bacterium MB13-C1-2]